MPGCRCHSMDVYVCMYVCRYVVSRGKEGGGGDTWGVCYHPPTQPTQSKPYICIRTARARHDARPDRIDAVPVGAGGHGGEPAEVLDRVAVPVILLLFLGGQGEEGEVVGKEMDGWMHESGDRICSRSTRTDNT